MIMDKIPYHNQTASAELWDEMNLKKCPKCKKLYAPYYMKCPTCKITLEDLKDLTEKK